MSDTTFDRVIKVVGAVGVIVGLFFTGCQIREAAKTQRSALLYQIQGDGRDILLTVNDLPSYQKCVILGAACNNSELENAQNGIRMVIQFFSSVYNQRRLDALDEEAWNVWEEELCGFFSLPIVSEFWADYGNSYSESFREVVSKCDS